MSYRTEILYQFLKGLEMGNADIISEVLAENAVVHSPMYGSVPAVHFYKILFAENLLNDLTLIDVFSSTQNIYTASVYFKYHWKLPDGTDYECNCVDIFTFNDAGKISDIMIIYDTAVLRGIFSKEALSKHVAL